MTPGFTDDLQDIKTPRKTAVIGMELSRLKMDIVALTGDWTCRIRFRERKRFLLLLARQSARGNPGARSWLCCQKPAFQVYCSPTEGSERLLVIQLHTTANLTCAYTPTLTASPESKDKIYDDFAQNADQRPNQHTRKWQPSKDRGVCPPGRGISPRGAKQQCPREMGLF